MWSMPSQHAFKNTYSIFPLLGSPRRSEFKMWEIENFSGSMWYLVSFCAGSHGKKNRSFVSTRYIRKTRTLNLYGIVATSVDSCFTESYTSFLSPHLSLDAISWMISVLQLLALLGSVSVAQEAEGKLLFSVLAMTVCDTHHSVAGGRGKRTLVHYSPYHNITIRNI